MCIEANPVFAINTESMAEFQTTLQSIPRLTSEFVRHAIGRCSKLSDRTASPGQGRSLAAGKGERDTTVRLHGIDSAMQAIGQILDPPII